MQLFSLLATAIALLCACQWDLAHCHEGDEETRSPYFLFMKKLRNHLSTAEIDLPNVKDHKQSNAEGRLIATSIEGNNSRGTGYGSKGFAFEINNELLLDFTISAESRPKKFPEVELWLFPDKTNVHAGNEKIIRYEAEAHVAALKTPRKDPGAMTWITSEDCVQINLTQLSNKIYNKFNKSSINESHVTLKIKITTVNTNLAVHQRNTPRPAHHKFCSSIAQRASNVSFIFIKNYAETGKSIVKNRRRRSVPVEVGNSSSSEPEKSCHKTTLQVNLTEVYGSFVKGPKLLDIGDCRGACSSSTKNHLFSHHSMAKERLKQLPKRKALINYVPCCVPVAFKPVCALFSLKEKSNVIVQLPDLVVSDCGCR